MDRVDGFLREDEKEMSEEMSGGRETSIFVVSVEYDRGLPFQLIENYVNSSLREYENLLTKNSRYTQTFFDNTKPPDFKVARFPDVDPENLMSVVMDIKFKTLLRDGARELGKSFRVEKI